MKVLGRFLCIFLLATVSVAVDESKKHGLRREMVEPSCSSNQVTALKVIDPVSNNVVDLCDLYPTSSCSPDYLTQGFFEHGQINILAETCSPDHSIECVKFFRDNMIIATEKSAPYALFGNRGNNFFGGTLPEGSYDLKACTYTSDDCNSGESGCYTWPVRVYKCSVDEDIFAFDAETNSCFSQVYNLLCLPESVSKLTFVAVPGYYAYGPDNDFICIDKVYLELIKPDGSKDETIEYNEPYSLYGNKGYDFFGRSLPPGEYTISAWANTKVWSTGFTPTQTFEIKTADDPDCIGWTPYLTNCRHLPYA